MLNFTFDRQDRRSPPSQSSSNREGTPQDPIPKILFTKKLEDLLDTLQDLHEENPVAFVRRVNSHLGTNKLGTIRRALRDLLGITLPTPA